MWCFISVPLILMEYNMSSTNNTTITIFTCGSTAAVAIPVSNDEEKGGVAQVGNTGVLAGKKAMVEIAATDVFSWQHTYYAVPIVGGIEQMLLNDVSVYIGPGKLTVLMGKSGVGKVRFPAWFSCYCVC